MVFPKFIVLVTTLCFISTFCSCGGGGTSNTNTPCKIHCSDSFDCDDNNALTLDVCNNPDTCGAVCSNTTCTPACSDDWDCFDNDDSTNDTCLNPNTCNSTCKNTLCVPVCATNSQCDDSNDSTLDRCTNPGTCYASCQNTSQQCEGTDISNEYFPMSVGNRWVYNTTYPDFPTAEMNILGCVTDRGIVHYLFDRWLWYLLSIVEDYVYDIPIYNEGRYVAIRSDEHGTTITELFSVGRLPKQWQEIGMDEDAYLTWFGWFDQGFYPNNAWIKEIDSLDTYDYWVSNGNISNNAGTITVPAGVFTDTKKYLIQDGYDYLYYVYFAKDIGIIKVEHISEGALFHTFELKSAIIDGVTY